VTGRRIHRFDLFLKGAIALFILRAHCSAPESSSVFNKD
jgi:hypothetical protein